MVNGFARNAVAPGSISSLGLICEAHCWNIAISDVKTNSVPHSLRGDISSLSEILRGGIVLTTVTVASISNNEPAYWQAFEQDCRLAVNRYSVGATDRNISDLLLINLITVRAWYYRSKLCVISYC